jgi:hypothetical protein
LEEKGRNMEKHRGAVLIGAGGGGLTHPSLGGGGRLEGKLGRERSRAGEETSAGKGVWAGEEQGGREAGRRSRDVGGEDWVIFFFSRGCGGD